MYKPAETSRQNHRKAALLLLLSMLLSGTACSAQPDSDGNVDTPDSASAQTTVDSSAGQPPEITRENTPDNLPALDFGGSVVRVLSRAGDADTKLEFDVETETGEIVSDAVYKRNLAVQDRLNVTIENIVTTANRHASNTDLVRKTLLASSDEYDVIADHMYHTMSTVLEGFYANLSELDYLDFSQPWWNQAYTELSAIDGKLYAAAGELSLTMVSGAYVMFFNSDLFSANYPDVNLYELVNDGQWTLDTLYRYCKGLYKDLNGDAAADENDFYGLYLRNKETLAADAFVGGVKLSVVEPDDSGSGYHLSVLNDRTIEFVEKLKNIIYDKTASCRGNYNDETVMQTMVNGTTIFTPWMLGAVSDLRDMKDNYGILPMPKLNDAQESYSTYAHNGFSVFTIPVTCPEPERSAAFLEAMCAETYRQVMPAYFETALKVKYSRDDLTAQMLDTIIAGVYLDLSYVYNKEIGGLIDTFRSMFASANACDTLSSTIASKEQAINSALDKIVTKYSELH